MPTTLSPESIANVALSKIGALPLPGQMSDLTSPSAIACNTNFQLAYLEVSRASRWNCLLTTAILTQVPQEPIPSNSGAPSNAATWAPNTTYQANTYLTYGGYYYMVEYTYTSTYSFSNDLTTGALVQTNLPTTGYPFSPDGSSYPSGWSYQYALPSDFQLLAALNDNVGWWGFSGYGAQTEDYEIMGSMLYCDNSQAVIQYVKNQPDTTQFDALFTGALTFKLASMIATQLCQDGGAMQAAMLQQYKVALREARQKNGGEQQERRFNPISTSRFIQSRYQGING